MVYMNTNDEEDEGMQERCAAALGELETKHPYISVVNLGYYVDTPHES